MPCIYGGMRITHYDGDPQGCYEIGGEWAEEPGLIPKPAETAALRQPTIGTSYPGSALQDPRKLRNLFSGPIGKSYPGSALQDPRKLRNLFSGPIGKSYSMGEGVQRSFTEPGLGYPNTDDSGRPLSTNFEGESNFGLMRDQAVTKFNEDAYNERNRYGVGGAAPEATPVDTPNYKDMFTPVKGLFSGTGFTDGGDIVTVADLDNMSVGKLINMSIEDIDEVPVLGDIHNWINPSADIGKLVDTITDPELRADAIQFVKDNPKTSGTAAVLSFLATKNKKVKKLWNKIEGRYKNNLVRNNAKTGKFEAVSSGFNKTKLATDAAKTYYGTKAVIGLTDPETGIQKEPLIKSIINRKGKKPNNNIVNNKPPSSPPSGLLSPRPDGQSGPLNSSGLLQGSNKLVGGADKTPPAKKASLWDRMQTGDYWMKGVDGGSGKWDNRLFRLGEQMSYMGTPLSKRGDRPSKRWTSANTEASKLKQALSKARGIAGGKATTAQRALWTNMVKAQSQNLKDKYMADKGGFLGFFKMSKEEQERKAVSLAQNEMAIKYEMIGFNIEPTSANYIEFLELRSKGLI